MHVLLYTCIIKCSCTHAYIGKKRHFLYYTGISSYRPGRSRELRNYQGMLTHSEVWKLDEKQVTHVTNTFLQIAHKLQRGRELIAECWKGAEATWPNRHPSCWDEARSPQLRGHTPRTTQCPLILLWILPHYLNLAPQEAPDKPTLRDSPPPQ